MTMKGLLGKFKAARNICDVEPNASASLLSIAREELQAMV